MYKVLVTGAFGYIGSLLTLKLLNAGYHVIALDNKIINLEYYRGFNNLEIINGDLTDKSILINCLYQTDSIIHLAAVSDGRIGRKNPNYTNILNVKALELLIDLSLKYKVSQFIFASTFGVYGNKYNTELCEELKVNPIEPYSLSKALGEEMISNVNSNDFKFTILRIAMVHGLSIFTRLDFLVNTLVYNSLIMNHLKIKGGYQKRPQIHINDLCEVFIEILTKNSVQYSNQIFNVVSENPSLKEIATNIKNQIPNLKVDYFKLLKNEDSFTMNGDKLVNILKKPYKFKIKDTIHSFLLNKNKIIENFKNGLDKKGLYL